MPPHLLDHSLADLEQRLRDWGEPTFRARQIARWALRRCATSFGEMTDLPATLRPRLEAEWTLAPPPVLAETRADDGATSKVLLDLGGGTAVEAVRMDYDPDRPEHAAGSRARSTVCVSTQAGCAMACVFCATGQQGFTRNLGAGEILAQVLHFQRERPVSNVVFMGMGEPLANYDPTLTAVRWLIDRDGLDLRARGVTISTVGLPGPIRRLAGEALQIGLTVSLHAPDDELRRRLIPTAGSVTLDGLIAASNDYVERTGRRVTFAYALLERLNDEPEQARRLASRIRGMRCHVNLIPYNPTAGEGLRRPSWARVRAFQRELQAAGVNATVRIERGIEIAAAAASCARTTWRRRRAEEYGETCSGRPGLHECGAVLTGETNIERIEGLGAYAAGCCQDHQVREVRPTVAVAGSGMDYIVGVLKDEAPCRNKLNQYIGDVGPREAVRALQYPDRLDGYLAAHEARLPFRKPIEQDTGGFRLPLDIADEISDEHVGVDGDHASVAPSAMARSMSSSVTGGPSYRRTP